jgi:hypothetical protein
VPLPYEFSGQEHHPHVTLRCRVQPLGVVGSLGFGYMSEISRSPLSLFVDALPSSPEAESEAMRALKEE